MKSSINTQEQSKEYFHRISVVGGGITGAFMVLLLKKSNLFKVNEICWIKPKIKINNDLRTTFFNQTNLKFLNNLGVLKKIDKGKYTSIKKIEVFGSNNVSPLVWDYKDPKTNFGAVVENNVILNSKHLDLSVDKIFTQLFINIK